MGRTLKARRCRGCGCILSPVKLWLCDDCTAAGVGARMSPYESADREALLQVAKAREERGLPPLEGMTMDEKSALAWLFRKSGYGSYGKLTGYVRATGKLPPMEGY